MKLTMKNIGVIRDAEIELDGITVLAGLNGTGKSTASKALYSTIAPYANLSKRVDIERQKSINRTIFFFLNRSERAYSRIVELSPSLASKLRPIPERYEEWVELFPEYLDNDSAWAKEAFPNFLEQLRNAVNRPNTDYVQYLANIKIQAVFNKQINTIGSPLSGEISLTIGEKPQTVWMKIAGNEITEYRGQNINASQPIYLDTRHVLDGLNGYSLHKEAPYNSELYRFLRDSGFEQTIEEYESYRRISELIASVICGRLTISSFEDFMFKDDHFPEPVFLRNVASGNKTFAVLQRLIENGALHTNTVLIIDEPESNQHPQWQLKLAETLVILHKELGVRLFLNTHSTYFLRAIEVYSQRYELASHCHYYLTQPAEDAEGLYHIRNADGETKLIYREFYLPFEEL
ncbi:MAG: AAA family ATPase [Oscillibacter sp.]|nr:AAA family ATPase [Oscillibacter sp.]